MFSEHSRKYGGIFTELLGMISTAGLTFDFGTDSYDWIIMIPSDHILEMQILLMDFSNDPDDCSYNYLKVSNFCPRHTSINVLI